MKLQQRRARGPEGYRDYLVKTVTYAKNDVVETYHPGTQYHVKRGYFTLRDSLFEPGQTMLICKKPVSWSWTTIQCPGCFDRMCPGYIKHGYCK